MPVAKASTDSTCSSAATGRIAKSRASHHAWRVGDLPPERPSLELTGFGRGGSKYTGLINAVLFTFFGALLLPVEMKGFPPSSIFLGVGLVGLAIHGWSLWRGRLSQRDY